MKTNKEIDIIYKDILDKFQDIKWMVGNTNERQHNILLELRKIQQRFCADGNNIKQDKEILEEICSQFCYKYGVRDIYYKQDYGTCKLEI